MKKKVLILLMLISSNVFASQQYSVESKEYRDTMAKIERDKVNSKVEVKDIDYLEPFKQDNAEVKYEREDGVIGATTSMRNFYDYRVKTTDGASYLFNQRLCRINPYSKKIKIISRQGWGWFLMPVDDGNNLSDPRDCSAVKELDNKTDSLLEHAEKWGDE